MRNIRAEPLATSSFRILARCHASVVAFLAKLSKRRKDLYSNIKIIPYEDERSECSIQLEINFDDSFLIHFFQINFPRIYSIPISKISTIENVLMFSQY